VTGELIFEKYWQAESSSEDCNPKLLCFAGGDVTDVYNDVHVLDMETLVWSPQQVLQCVAVCCSVLQCVAVCCSVCVLHCVAVVHVLDMQTRVWSPQ